MLRMFLKLQEVLPQHVLMGLMRWMMTISPSVQGLKIAKEQDFSVSWKSMQLMWMQFSLVVKNITRWMTTPLIWMLRIKLRVWIFVQIRTRCSSRMFLRTCGVISTWNANPKNHLRGLDVLANEVEISRLLAMEGISHNWCKIHWQRSLFMIGVQRTLLCPMVMLWRDGWGKVVLLLESMPSWSAGMTVSAQQHQHMWWTCFQCCTCNVVQKGEVVKLKLQSMCLPQRISKMHFFACLRRNLFQCNLEVEGTSSRRTCQGRG